MKQSTFIITLVLLFSLKPIFAYTEKEYEEIPFESIVDDLNQHIKHKSKTTGIVDDNSDPFDSMTIYTSFGLLNSIHYFQINNQSLTRFREGVNIGVGVDLFNPNWIAEANIKNYGKSIKAQEFYSLREFDLRLSFRTVKSNNISYKFVQGLGARYLKYQSIENQINTKEQTPIYLMGVSIDSIISKNLSLGFELSGTTALISETIDRNSINLNLKLDNYF